MSPRRSGVGLFGVLTVALSVWLCHSICVPKVQTAVQQRACDMVQVATKTVLRATATRDQQIRDAYQAGSSIASIARAADLDRSTVSRILGLTKV